MSYAVTGAVTREELEAALRREGFVQQGSVWWSQDRTKFVSFPDDHSDEAIYGDSEIGEPGRTVPLAVASEIVRGERLLDSPLGVAPAQAREPAVLAAPSAARALPPSPPGLTPDDPLHDFPTRADFGRADFFIRPTLWSGSGGGGAGEGGKRSFERDTIRPPPNPDAVDADWRASVEAQPIPLITVKKHNWARAARAVVAAGIFGVMTVVGGWGWRGWFGAVILFLVLVAPRKA